MGVPLQVAKPLDSYVDPWGAPVVVLGLAGQHQRINAALAVALASSWEARNMRSSSSSSMADRPEGSAARRQRLEELSAGCLPPAYLQGLQACCWAGRSQVHCCSSLCSSSLRWDCMGS